METLFQNTEQYFILLSPEFQNIKSTISYVTHELTSMRTGYFCLETPPQISDGSRFLKVIRCDENSTANKDGAFWKISPCSRWQHTRKSLFIPWTRHLPRRVQPPSFRTYGRGRVFQIKFRSKFPFSLKKVDKWNIILFKISLTFKYALIVNTIWCWLFTIVS